MDKHIYKHDRYTEGNMALVIRNRADKSFLTKENGKEDWKTVLAEITDTIYKWIQMKAKLMS